MARTNNQAHSLDQLRQWLPRGTRVFTILRSVSRSGMRREVSVVVWQPGEDRPIHPNIMFARRWVCVVARTMAW
jgi:hypothetical protein